MKRILYTFLLIYIIVLGFLQYNCFYTGGYSFGGTLLYEIISLPGYLGLCEYLDKLYSVIKLKKKGVMTYATIKDHNITYNRTKRYYPIVIFKTASKKTYEYELSESTMFLTPKYKKGRKIKLYYDPDNPFKYAIIPNSIYFNVMAIFIFSVFCIPFMILALGYGIEDLLN